MPTGTLEDLIELMESNDNQFDLDNSIEEAKLALEEEMKKKKLSNCHFEEMTWCLENIDFHRNWLKFDEIISAIQFNEQIKTQEFIQIVKCWTASLIGEGYASGTIQEAVRCLKHFLVLTKGFTETNTDELADTLIDMGKKSLMATCNSVLNFFDYYSDFSFDTDAYITLLYSVKPSWEDSVRLLPSSKDILIFSKVLEDYFSKNLTELEYLRWFPIWLWWNLTTLIPLRPSEYCKIKRECLFEKDGHFYINLPREKIKYNNKRNIQILDTIMISARLYRKIEEYIQRTDSYGKSKTLISYRSIPTILWESYHLSNTYKKRLSSDTYTLPIFREHLKSFYEKILLGEYNILLTGEDINVNRLFIKRQLLPGDTRHLAFMNLNRQGYHPVEIARLGGHSTLHSQNHYFNHIGNYVDLEILELITKVDLGSSNNQEGSEPQHEQSIGMSFIEKYILKPSNTDFKIKMIDGYCTDPHQNCKVEDCWECPSWRISQEEFMEKRNILEQKLTNTKTHLNEVIDNLKDIYRSIYTNTSSEFYSSDNPGIHKELINKSKRIDYAIRKYINLTKVKERIDSIGKER